MHLDNFGGLKGEHNVRFIDIFKAGCIWSYLVSSRMHLRDLELKAGYTLRFFVISRCYALGVVVWPQRRVHYKSV